jgi:hypothetical protein
LKIIKNVCIEHEYWSENGQWDKIGGSQQGGTICELFTKRWGNLKKTCQAFWINSSIFAF